MTSGGGEGASGEAENPQAPPPSWTPYAVFAAIAFVIVVVNATSRLMEARRHGEDLAAWEPFTWELSSFLLTVSLMPLVRRLWRRFPITRENLIIGGLTQLGLSLPYSAAHVSGMVGLRKLVYAAMGSAYDFSHGALGLEFLYEWRKDLLAYAGQIFLYWAFAYWTKQAISQPAPALDARLEFKDGASRFYLAPAEIFWIEAAGNYVEINTGAGKKLVRGVLSAFETRLAPYGFVRAHRSRLVNRARVASVKPNAAGDVEIAFDDGRSVAGSRRYREGLGA